MARECKHQWRYLEKRHNTLGEKTLYIFFCIKCLRFKRLTNEDL